MLTKDEIEEIRKILEESNNPIYLFDDDGDGLCSYLLLKKHYKKGKGMPIKNAGALDTSYTTYIYEEKADLVVILDKALVKQEFIDEAKCKVLYIDHHPIQKLNKVNYFNPLFNNKDIYMPTSYLTYKVTNSNIWIATIGCLFDYYIPEFMKEFMKEYPDLLKKINQNPGYILFETNLGKLVKLFAFNMKGKPNEIKKSLEFLEKIESPYEILNETNEYGKFLKERYEKLNKEYEALLEKAKKCQEENNLIIFEYPSTRISFNQYLATELSYLNQDKTIIIAREKDNDFKLSLRNQKKDISKMLSKALEGIKGRGGGHVHACGASVDKKDYEKFIEKMRKLQ